MVDTRKLLKKIFGIIMFYSGYYYLHYFLTSRQRVAILMYHRINNKSAKNWYNPALISSDADNFEKQMQYLKKKYNVISFDEYVQNKKKPNSVIITFDDGYKDNYLVAYPILKKLGLSATIFPTTSFIGSNKLPWWDKIEYIFQKTEIKHFTFLSTKYSVTKNRNDIVQRIVGKLKDLPENQKKNMVDMLQKQFGVKIPKADDLFLTWDEIMEMSRNNIFFGAHTVTHPILTKMSPKNAENEIVNARNKIEHMLNKKIRVFSYPNGQPKDMSKSLNDFLKKSGFQVAVTCLYGLNTKETNPFVLKRIGIESDDDLRMFRLKLEGIGKNLAKLYLHLFK